MFLGIVRGRRQLQIHEVRSRLSPVPSIALSINHQHKTFQSFRETKTNREMDLITPELRLALNPRVQWISFYQYNTAINRNTLNTRLQWEYKPLSFIFIVLNDNRQDFMNNETMTTSRMNSQSGIVKVTYLKQF